MKKILSNPLKSIVPKVNRIISSIYSKIRLGNNINRTIFKAYKLNVHLICVPSFRELIHSFDLERIERKNSDTQIKKLSGLIVRCCHTLIYEAFSPMIAGEGRVDTTVMTVCAKKNKTDGTPKIEMD